MNKMDEKNIKMCAALHATNLLIKAANMLNLAGHKDASDQIWNGIIHDMVDESDAGSYWVLTHHSSIFLTEDECLDIERHSHMMELEADREPVSSPMKAYIKRPGSDVTEIVTDNSLSALQKLVGGYIETVGLGYFNCKDGDRREVVAICNEEGRLMDLEPCCSIKGYDFVGPVLFVGVDGAEFTDCPEFDLDFIREFEV